MNNGGVHDEMLMIKVDVFWFCMGRSLDRMHGFVCDNQMRSKEETEKVTGRRWERRLRDKRRGWPNRSRQRLPQIPKNFLILHGRFCSDAFLYWVNMQPNHNINQNCVKSRCFWIACIGKRQLGRSSTTHHQIRFAGVETRRDSNLKPVHPDLRGR